jgi:glucosyl-3-phosphoglycerate synthase
MTSIRILVPDRRGADEVVAEKRDRTIAVCIPCHDEAATIGRIVRTVNAALVDRVGLVDELLVVDDRSTDASAMIARREGATVVPVEPTEAGDQYGGSGKGNVLWTALARTTSDFVVFCDADVTSFRAEWVTRLVAPLLADSTLAIVKPSYHRPTAGGGGGRTTELVARPLLALCAPPLHALAQPLAGETAARRDVLERLALPCGWGVEVAMVMDVAAELGPQAIGQVDLGVRTHRHRPLAELTVQAAEIAATILGRAGLPRRGGVVRLASGEEVVLRLRERPPLTASRCSRPSADPATFGTA